MIDMKHIMDTIRDSGGYDYVYAHYDIDGRVFYIGKGSNAYRINNKTDRSAQWNAVAINGYTKKILFNHLTRLDAYKVERHIINNIGLCNLTNRV